MDSVSIVQLGLPILLSAVFVFLVSSVIHMATPMHKNDMGKLPDEESIMAAMRKASVQPGEYCMPRPTTMKEMCTPEFTEKYKLGPVAVVTVMPSGPPSVGKSLAQWFVWTLVVGVFVGYITALACPAGTHYGTVFQVAGTVGILGYAFCNVTNSIWKGVSWGTTFKFVIDGVLYALVTAGTFGWLWPAASAAG